MVKLNVGKLNVSFGNKKKEEPPAPAKPVERRCAVCGTYTTTTSDTCPKCHSRL